MTDQDNEHREDNAAELATQLQRHIDRQDEGGYGIECPDCGVAHHLVYVHPDGTAEIYRRIGQATTGAEAVAIMRNDEDERDARERPPQIH